ncbi:MAG: zinc ribbon domain-containing protein, partial [Methanomassiliicoccaceae archaeon]|nr:zinc ribbon domain-containing protein [Methanomassiliicoccaceae archaeon]
LVEGNQGDPPDSGHFTDVEYTFVGNEIQISAILTDMDDVDSVIFRFGEVLGIGFGLIVEGAVAVGPLLESDALVLDTTDGSVSGTVEVDGNTFNIDRGKLYIGHLAVKKTGEESFDRDSATYTRFLTDAFDGDVTSLCLYGCLISTVYVMIIFLMIMLFSNFMRGRMERTRERMEQEGRLYPQGYGKCEECGAIVLPGEVNCRKCGAYIDRPEEMKPNKKDFFECSECGAEVPSDARRCPKCGAEFDEEESEVVHADGSVETTKETFVCRECGAENSAASTFCTKCGAKFNEK